MRLKSEINLYFFIVILLKFLYSSRLVSAKSVIMANYHNVLLFFPKEYGGNDDLRVIFDVRNVTIGTFKYMPVIVDIAYDSVLNQAYCYMESAITSYIMLLKWSGGSWCYQVLFDFPASQFSKYMYHSIIVVDNFIYWSTDRYIMSGRLPGYEKRLLLQPGWNRLYSMTLDKKSQLIYVAAFDYTENALFRCNLRVFSCIKILRVDITINYIYFNIDTLYVASIQGNYLYRYAEDYNSLMPVNTVDHEVANILFFDDQYAIYTNQQSITITTNINMPNSSRKANAHLIDPYALQYVFTFNQIANFDTYPYPYYFSDYHDLLYRNSLYIFYFYICGMDFVENDHVFLPQMDLNNQFLRVENCETRFLEERYAYLIPSIIAGCVTLFIVTVAMMICCWRSKFCDSRRNHINMKIKNCFHARKIKENNDNKNHQNIFFGKQEAKPEKILKLGVPNKQQTLSNSSGISSLPSVSDRMSSSYVPELPSQLPPPQQTLAYTQNIYFPTKIPANQSAFDSELYDNDPINLNDLDYSRYLNNPNNKSKNSNGHSSCKIYTMKACTKTKKHPSSILSSPSTISGSTPTLSQNSYVGGSSINSTVTIDSLPSSLSFPSSPKVKFNEFQIHHHYDQYDSPNSSPLPIPHSKTYESTIKMLPQYLLTHQYQEQSSSSSSTLNSSSDSSIDNKEVENTDNKKITNVRIKGRYYNKEYISTCNVPLYSTKMPQNYVNVVKAVKPAIKNNESVDVFSI